MDIGSKCIANVAAHGCTKQCGHRVDGACGSLTLLTHTRACKADKQSNKAVAWECLPHRAADNQNIAQTRRLSATVRAWVAPVVYRGGGGVARG